MTTSSEDQTSADDAAVELREPDRMTEDDIQEVVAKLIQERLVLASQIPLEMVTSVFMVLAFGGLSHFKPESVGNVVEDLDKAGPRSVNGYPVFFSCRVIHIDDWKMIVQRYNKARAALDEALEG